MTALAGICSFGGGGDTAAAAALMLDAQKQYGPHRSSLAKCGHAVFGRRLFKILPEDNFDRQPLIDETGNRIFVADLRIDNRSDLLGELGYRTSASISDAELLFRAYGAWRCAVFDRVAGDFAVAIWDEDRRTLTLARDPVGQRPLYYYPSAGFVAFSTMPEGLRALPGVQIDVDRRHLAAFVADIARPACESHFEGVLRVEPGHIVNVSPSRLTTQSYWQMPQHELRLPKHSDYVEAFREQLDRAVQPRLRAAKDTIGAHLSAGLDSGAVTATAARLRGAQGARLLAFTAAPPAGFNGPAPPGRIADESGPAAAVVDHYENIDHVVVRSKRSLLEAMRSDADLFQEPIGFPCNHLWWSAVNEDAKRRGVSVMLTGQAGNLTMSAGGISLLAKFIQHGQWLTWTREAFLLSRGLPTWRGILATSFGPWMPQWLWTTLVRRGSEEGAGTAGRDLLGHPWKNWASAVCHEDRSGRPAKDERQGRWAVLCTHDPGNYRKAVLGRWGIDERDPTADRRLAEFCFSLPAALLLKGGQTRSLARRGLSDRLPVQTLQGLRGYQAADWYLGLDPESVRRELSDLEGTGGSSLAVLDFGRLRNLVDQWPSNGWATWPVISTYRMALLRALSAGYFARKVR